MEGTKPYEAGFSISKVLQAHICRSYSFRPWSPFPLLTISLVGFPLQPTFHLATKPAYHLIVWLFLHWPTITVGFVPFIDFPYLLRAYRLSKQIDHRWFFLKICQAMVKNLAKNQRRSFQRVSVQLIVTLEVAMAHDFSGAISDRRKGGSRVSYRKLLSFIFTVQNLISYSLYTCLRETKVEMSKCKRTNVSLAVCGNVEQADFRRIHHFGGTKFEKFRERFDLFPDEDSPHEREKI